MWQLQQRLAKSNLAAITADLFQTATRNLILTVLGMYLLWHFAVTASWPEVLGRLTWFITLVIVPIFALALYLLSKNFFISQLTWQAGVAVAITMAIYLFQRAELAFLYALLPLVAVVTLGWPVALLTEGVIVGLLWWLLPWLGYSLSPAYLFIIILSGLVAGLVGWASVSTLFTVIHWTFMSWEQAQQNAKEAQEHRAEIMQLYKDLNKVNYQLERANSALMVAWKAADEAEHFKAEFVTNVSHELRTPLNLIGGFTQMMVTSPESYGGVQLPRPYRADLHTVYRSSQHLLELVDDVLDLARIDAGKVALARYDVDLPLLISETAAIVREYITAKGLELRLNIATDLPIVWIDRLRIRQVLLNLLTNASRHTKQGWIEIEAVRQDNQVVINVKDTGPGIPPANLDKIFEEFRSTSQPTSTWHSGTGLGLPISKKFVELHHGQMGVDSVMGQGSCFWFTLPITTNISLVAPQFASSTENLAEHFDERPQPVVRLDAPERVIIVVSDDPDQSLSFLKRYLDGYQVMGATDWAEGARLAQEVKALAFVTADAKLLPPDFIDLPIIHCPLPSNRLTATNFGAENFLVKPVSRQELLTAIDRLPQPVERILVVDDDPEVVRLFKRMLVGRISTGNYFEAYNGQEALQVMREQKPDLVILDLIMPEVDGETVLAEIARDPTLAHIPVILASATGQDHINMRLSGSIKLFKAEGFELGDVIRMLDVMLKTLAPEWDRLAARPPGSSVGLAELPA